jgi:polyhydroxyalkanoate synthesis repressor PhaR
MMLTIKRYPNRKLYDTTAKRYVTLEQIAALVRQGAEVQVVDHENGEDLTTTILTQIILEQEKKQSGFLPRTLLTTLIRSSGETLDAVRHTLDERIASVLHTLNVPTQQDLQALHAQLDALDAQLSQMVSKVERPKSEVQSLESSV